ncbi:MAG: DUF5324 family protein, partial [Streptomycetales bacterium]
AGKVLGPQIEHTRKRLEPQFEATREAVGPAVGAAADRVREDVVPRVAEAVSEAVEAAWTRSEPTREEALARGAAALAALRGELTVETRRSRKGRRIRRLLLLLGFAGSAAAGWAVWKRKSQPEWILTESSENVYQPTPASIGDEPGTERYGATRTSSDAGGASPDEALADSADEERRRG